MNWETLQWIISIALFVVFLLVMMRGCGGMMGGCGMPRRRHHDKNEPEMTEGSGQSADQASRREFQTHGHKQ